MSENMSENSYSNTCVVCYKNVKFYSIGMCEHPVCFECSTRMRVLCQQNECPICRQDLPKVVFTEEIRPFRHLRKSGLFDSQYNIYFDNQEIQNKFNTLLAHTCKLCSDKQMFNNFNSLKDHMRRKHELHYCDLCVKDLKIFSNERRCYTRADLALHRRKGDVDDKSHKGHPLCEFCDQRYMDNDELYRHLRRDHLFCHFCDADGLHHYYSSYDYLREHFRQEHFLCEEGSCVEEKFTSVFRSDIDLKAHKASMHGKQLGKAAAKQARTLELEFTLAPRDNRVNRRGPPGPRTPRDYIPEHSRDQELGAVGGMKNFMVPEEPIYVKQPSVDMHSTQEFPTLGNTAPIIPNIAHMKGRGNLTIRSGRKPGQITDEDFPALGPSSDPPSVSKSVNLSVSSSASSSGHSRPQSSTGPNLSIHVNHKSNGTLTTRVSGPNIRIRPLHMNEDFPALGSASSQPTVTNAVGQWTKVTTCIKKPETPRAKKVASPPPVIRSGEDFPSLQRPSKANKQLSVSTSSSATADATKGKAKKKKVKQTQGNGTTGFSEALAKKISDKNSKSGNEAKMESGNAGSSKKEPQNQNRVSSNGTSVVQRKRSELKIDSLNSSNNNVQRSQDFPALGSSGTNRPPPGFSISAPVVSPPPGFFGKACTKAPHENGLTFTNSSGESYSIVPDNNKLKQYSFAAPTDFQKRNKNLVANVREALDNEDDLNEFRYVSGLFRQGICDAEEYYIRCRDSMGISAYEKIFPELLVLLPDIEKQQELFRVHKKEMSSPIKNLEPCATCEQILRSFDLKAHLANHTLELQFPALGIATPYTNNTPWLQK